MFTTAIYLQHNDGSPRCEAYSIKPPPPHPQACFVKGDFNIITYVCATTHSITFYCLFCDSLRADYKSDFKWKDRASFNAGTISLDYVASNSTMCSDSLPPGPALALEKGDFRI